MNQQQSSWEGGGNGGRLAQEAGSGEPPASFATAGSGGSGLAVQGSAAAATVAGTRWEALRPCARDMNAWLFVRSDDIPPALRPYRDFQEWKLQLNDFTGAVYEGRLYGPDDFTKLEAMPTRAQSYQYLLGCLQMPAVNVLAALRARQEAMAQADKPPAEAEAAAGPEK